MARRGRRLGAAVCVAVLAALCAAASPPRPTADPGPLPADRYTSTHEDYQRSQQASALLVRACMAELGHPDFPLNPRYPSDPLVMTAVSTQYGVLDADAAGRWGYGWDPAKHTDSLPQGRRMTQAEYADQPGCSAEASRRLARGTDRRDWLFVSSRTVEVDKEVRNDPRLRAAWDVWSRCLTDQGFPHYADPVAAYGDRAWKRGSDGNTQHTRQERATAVADVACKRRHDTAEIWHSVRAEKEAADIAAHPKGYAGALRALETYRANIAEVLRSSG